MEQAAAREAASLVEWLERVAGAWSDCSAECKTCPQRVEANCEILNAPRIPAGECPAVLAAGVRRPPQFAGYPRAALRVEG